MPSVTLVGVSHSYLHVASCYLGAGAPDWSMVTCRRTVTFHGRSWRRDMVTDIAQRAAEPSKQLLKFCCSEAAALVVHEFEVEL